VSNDLVSPNQLSDFPGAPFTDAAVDAVVARLRREAGWHIAPRRTETVTVDGSDTRLLVLPTLELTDVTEVRDVTVLAAPVVVPDWRAARAGMLRRSGGWPRGYLSVAADITHGYEECPADLLPVIATLCKLSTSDGEVNQESLGSWSVTLRESLPQDQAETLQAYSIPRFR
jgi:hypothetical protein